MGSNTEKKPWTNLQPTKFDTKFFFIIFSLKNFRNILYLKHDFISLYLFTYQSIALSTVGENIIATIKMRNNFCYPLKMVIFFYSSPFSYRSSNFAIAKVVPLNLWFKFWMSFVDWFMASFLCCFPYSYRTSNYCDSKICRSFTFLKVLVKSNGNLFAIALKIDR